MDSVVVRLQLSEDGWRCCCFLSLPPKPSDPFPQTALSHKQQNLQLGRREESHHREESAADYFSKRGRSDVTVPKYISPSLHRLGAVSVRAHLLCLLLLRDGERGDVRETLVSFQDTAWGARSAGVWHCARWE